MIFNTHSHLSEKEELIELYLQECKEYGVSEISAVGYDFASSKKSLEVVSLVPINKLLIETDYSFLTDTPNIAGRETFNKHSDLFCIH